MEQALREFLNENEQILWNGKSEPFPLLDKKADHGKKILIEWIVEALLGAALLVVYANNNGVSPAFFLAVIAIVAVLVLSPVLEQNSIMGTRYWITDQHIILMQKNKSIFSMKLGSVDGFRIVLDESPSPCLVVGRRIFNDINKQLRWRCCHPMGRPSSGKDDNAQGIVFYNVKNLDQAETLLEKYAAAL